MQDRLFDAMAAAVCLVALSVAVDNVDGLRWPYDGDHYRDVAQAQTARDGQPLSDPFYPGERLWYNPLVPWIVAAGSAIARVSPAEFHVQGGPWLNLLAPAAFYLLGARLAGRGAAFAALVIFTFFNCRTQPALTCPTYSCWLFVATFAQGLFYLSLLALAAASNGISNLRAAGVGLLAGLTFLAHTAPALVLGAIALATLKARSIVVAGLTALIVAAPFLYSIVGHYHLAIVNPAPMAWRWLPVTIEGFPGAVRTDAMLIAGGLAGAFLVRHRIVRWWLIVSLGLTAYGIARDVMPTLPPVVPAFHFWRSALAVLTLLAGATVWAACQKVAGRYAGVALAISASIAVIASMPAYRTRFDFAYGRSIAGTRDPNHAEATAFLRRSTSRDAVVLGSRGASLQIIGPAGRKVVAVNANWSNPYVENVQRVQDRDAMLEALKAADLERFAALADAYRVTHVVGVGPEECAQMTRPPVQLLYTFGEVCVFQRRVNGRSS